MRMPLNYLLIFVVILSLSGVSFAEEEVKTIQSEINTTHSTEMYFGINLDGKSVVMHADGDTKIIKGGKEIKFSDLSAQDKVDISYVKRGGFLGLGGTYSVRTIKVLE